MNRDQLRAAGISDEAIDVRLAHKRLHPLHAAVFAVGHTAPIPLGRETAALLACGEPAVLSHLSAAAVWDLRVADETEPVDVTVPWRRRRRQAGIRVHRTRYLPACDISVRHRLPVTSPARTLLDIAEQVSRRELEKATDEALIQGIASESQIADVVRRAKERRGARLLAEVLSARDGSTLTQSEAGELFRALMRAAQLPLPAARPGAAGAAAASPRCATSTPVDRGAGSR